jgi:hypothetical protein
MGRGRERASTFMRVSVLARVCTSQHKYQDTSARHHSIRHVRKFLQRPLAFRGISPATSCWAALTVRTRARSAAAHTFRCVPRSERQAHPSSALRRAHRLRKSKICALPR